ncbi:MAG: hypothetical protein EOO28_15270 [Comamonadaceae bacterium]|nr:MAG: hypothetical protein EOO28_15270 [Comamonadaceae bacterium]
MEKTGATALPAEQHHQEPGPVEDTARGEVGEPDESVPPIASPLVTANSDGSEAGTGGSGWKSCPARQREGRCRPWILMLLALGAAALPTLVALVWLWWWPR